MADCRRRTGEGDAPRSGFERLEASGLPERHGSAPRHSSDGHRHISRSDGGKRRWTVSQTVSPDAGVLRPVQLGRVEVATAVIASDDQDAAVGKQGSRLEETNGGHGAGRTEGAGLGVVQLS